MPDAISVSAGRKMINMRSAPSSVDSIVIPRTSIAIVLALMLAMTMSYCDRYVLNLVVEPIKRDLVLSDTAVSLVQGFTFSIFFVVCGLPLGLLADRARRLTIVAVGVLLWSLATCACGLVTSFGGLLACRIAVAVGEATLTPAAFSLFADILPRRRLGLGVGVFSLGIYLGAGLAFIGGATFLAHMPPSGGLTLPLLGRVHGWQALFLLVGLVGLPLALWISTLREPPRTGMSAALARAPLADVGAIASEHRRILSSLFLCAGFAALTSQAYAAWMPSYLVRDFGWSVPKAGSFSGLMIIIGGLSGVLVAGLIGDSLRSRGLRNGRLIVMIGSALAAFLPSVAAPLTGDARAALALMLLSMFFNTILLTSAAPAVQELIPNRMQGTIVALYALVTTFIGLGLGPTAVALLTDHVFNDEHRVGVSLSCVSFLSISVAALIGWSALEPYNTSLAKHEPLPE